MSTKIKAEVFLEFIENHLPGLKVGKYRFGGKQRLSVGGIGEKDRVLDLPSFQVKVEGERFTINPSEIVSVFPPDNGLGHYANALPQIAFKRDTLPWERTLATAENQKEKEEERLAKAPWMALLVLTEDEVMTEAGAKPGSVKERQAAEGGYVKTGKALANDPVSIGWPPRLDESEHAGERFKVVYVKKETLQELLPDEEGLTLLAHARKSRIKLSGVRAEQPIEVLNEKGDLVHQEMAAADDCSIDCGPLEAGAYTVRVDGAEIADQPLRLKPSDEVGGETAIVVANRLPAQGVKSIVHLVSLEGRYKKDGKGFVFDFEGYGDAVPLVSLHGWSFTALTEKETFRHILLHLNHQFLFGIDADLPAKPGIDDLRRGFLDGRRPLSDQAKIADRAKKELRDKDHCYYIGESGALYDVAGRKVADGDGAVPAHKGAASELVPGHRLHERTASYVDARTRQLWVVDGDTNYFVSEDRQSKRWLVHLLPADATPSLRLPGREGEKPGTEKANHFLKQGYLPLPHHFRRGGNSVSWYRSPLLPGRPGKQISDDQFPVHTADELLRYDTSCGMFDASYAAAWELGRLLCLRNKRVSLALYRWKRSHARSIKAVEQSHLHAHLPYQPNAPQAGGLPEIAEQWLSEISLLNGLPFSYLVPDERMLPMESLRFFYLDPSWIASLVDGALSIGRVKKGQDDAIYKLALTDRETVGSGDLVSGFLLRSSVVKGWPNLQVNAYNPSAAENDETGENAETKGLGLPCLRLKRLAENVLFGLFDGEVEILDIHENPQTIHCGFMMEDTPDHEIRGTIYPRNKDGRESDVLLEPEGDNGYFEQGMRLIRPDKLAIALQRPGLGLGYETFTSAQLALSLTEGVSRVRFMRT